MEKLKRLWVWIGIMAKRFFWTVSFNLFKLENVILLDCRGKFWSKFQKPDVDCTWIWMCKKLKR